MRVALGWRAHSGCAARVALGGDGRAPQLVERARVEVCGCGVRVGAGLPPWAAAALVALARA
jgi:hypothetical protein